LYEDRQTLQQLVFNRFSYDEKLKYCDRPEQIEGPSEEIWKEINSHLKTNASNLQEFFQELGKRKFGHVPRVGDAFCGGGSVPFEVGRMGCDVYGSDLNPIAVLLTWASLNIVGGEEETARKVRQARETIYVAIDKQITEWGIEHNENGARADAYLYCIETRCPECGYMIPLAPSWVIGETTKTIAKLIKNDKKERYDVDILSNVSKSMMTEAKNSGTVRSNALHCPNCPQSTPITMIRGDRRGENGTQYGLRLWDNEDLVPRDDDIFRERLYCIRWVETKYDEKGNPYKTRYYKAPDENDLKREQKVLELLQDRFNEWQTKGYIPTAKIEPGNTTNHPIKTRGWTYWHHLFNPRQLLVGGLLNKEALKSKDKITIISAMLGLQKSVDNNSRLSGWSSSAGKELVDHVFGNQALNTLNNYGNRGFVALDTPFKFNFKRYPFKKKNIIEPKDARIVNTSCDLWITDPPYADAISYHELSEFFISWIEGAINEVFGNWYTDSKRALAITGSDETFRKSMVDSYRNLANHMPDNGMQIVMFTHQDSAIWADLALILWAAGLRVTSAWTIATETDSALKQGNYVQGTVLLVLRKQTSDESAFEDEIRFHVENAVKTQLDSMLLLDDKEDPNFGDTDYQLAAYAAALRVLTQYKNIEDFDIEYELSRHRQPGEKSPLENIIEDAVKVACSYLVPTGFNEMVWKILTPEGRFYLKGLELESHGEFRAGAYQELAKGFGLREYKFFFASSKANQVRLKNAVEFGTKVLGNEGFGSSLVRHALFAVREAHRTETTQTGKNWLRNEFKEYWNQRKNLVEVLNYLAGMENKSDSWNKCGKAARLVAGAVENDHA
jgi:putative DNA methylase